MKRRHGYIPMSKKPRARAPATVIDRPIKKTTRKSRIRRLDASPSFSSDSSSGSPSSLPSSFSSPVPLDFTPLSEEKPPVALADQYSAAVSMFDSLSLSPLSMGSPMETYADDLSNFQVEISQKNFFDSLDETSGIYDPATASFVAPNSLALSFNSQEQVGWQPWITCDFFLPGDYTNSPQVDYLPENASPATSTSSLLDFVPSSIPFWIQDNFGQQY